MFWVYGALVVAGVVWNIGAPVGTLLLGLAVGLVLWTPLEYVLHRYGSTGWRRIISITNSRPSCSTFLLRCGFRASRRWRYSDCSGWRPGRGSGVRLIEAGVVSGISLL